MKWVDEKEYDRIMRRRNAIKLFNAESYYRSAFSNLKEAFRNLIRYEADYLDALEESGYSNEDIKKLKEIIPSSDTIEMGKIIEKWDEMFSYEIISNQSAEEGDVK